MFRFSSVCLNFTSQLLICITKVQFNKKLYNQLQDRFLEEYKLEIIIQLNELNSSNYQKFAHNLTLIQKFIKVISKFNLSSIIIQISDLSNTFEFQWRFQRANFKKELLITITNKLFHDQLSLEIFQNLRTLLIDNIQQQIQITSNKVEKKELKNLLSSGQFFSFQTYKIPGLADYDNASFNETVKQLAANNFQVLAYYKSIFQFQIINPAHLLYDLYSESI
ncbi:hypothetical protein TTHERM_000595488 (macronuclear) [Tetrahymena thermophila SB210]|uniref:Uncharacterized protein n=1 Tax=Tetrahymena thermophila (strain SB210) TaxID=312017 RepID=W7XDF4_TETTS|nr:hypothetical protein TTHERM_000595488 [Tetrahymena thermophila SB210]EWS75582.1 hypothetical protein TTHERM_000595488 [Tetrahymena thermophila SB210]|eukprot:XP_012651882.1 hypothetical protein TTHERM_000595488 [Tetrahymena thermophila SB210]